jgi:DtxR family Mn-dependent transcriptional regulator
MAMENYLLSIIRLQEQDTKVTAAQLSEHFKSLPMGEGLGTSLPSVSAMIRRMTREKLVTTGSDKEISLTKTGLTEAESILRRHRLAERLAVDVLKVDLRRAHEEAHRLEHAFSPYLESRVVEILGYPTTCPFGHPIPGSKYVFNSSTVFLNKAKVGEDYLVERVPEDDTELLGYFVDNDFLPGAHIQITDLSNARGVITLQLANKELVFSMGISNLVRVTPV